MKWETSRIKHYFFFYYYISTSLVEMTHGKSRILCKLPFYLELGIWTSSKKSQSDLHQQHLTLKISLLVQMIHCFPQVSLWWEGSSLSRKVRKILPQRLNSPTPALKKILLPEKSSYDAVSLKVLSYHAFPLHAP